MAMPGSINGNGQMDGNFKRQIDQMKLNLNTHTQMTTHMGTELETPVRGRMAYPHNDSMYQSSVANSVGSGMGLTPKIGDPIKGGKRRSAAPFGFASTELKAGSRVPPILLANENKMRNQQLQDITSPTDAYNNKVSLRHVTAGG